MSISYVQKKKKMAGKNIVINNFAFQVTFEIIRNSEDFKP